MQQHPTPWRTGTFSPSALIDADGECIGHVRDHAVAGRIVDAVNLVDGPSAAEEVQLAGDYANVAGILGRPAS